MPVARTALVLLALISLSACATSRPRTTSSPRNPDVITRAEIERAMTTSSAYALVARLRPFWLRKHGSHTVSGTDDIVVYVDGFRMGGPAKLRHVNLSIVEEIRFLRAREASLYYGGGHSHGAIVVSSRDGSHLR